MSRLAKIFEIKREGINVPRALVTVGMFLIVLLVVVLVGEEKYWENVTFGALFVALSDPGGPYGARVRTMTWVALGGAFVTGLGYAIGGGLGRSSSSHPSSSRSCAAWRSSSGCTRSRQRCW